MPPEDRWKVPPSAFAHLHLGLSLYPWQIEVLDKAGTQHAVALAAANESGKTTFIVAPLVLWFLWRFPRGQVVITSGAFRQVSHQLWPSMTRFQEYFPDWEWQNVHIKTPEGGWALGFTVTDAGRFEGHHPKIDAQTDPVLIIVDEAKTVGEDIFAAVDRCGPQFQLFVSSPGAPAGQFYRCFGKERELYWTRKVASVECPHINDAKRQRDLKKYGIDHPVYRSMHLAEFPEDDGNLILSPGKLQHALENQPEEDPMGEWVAFIDFAVGMADEWVIAVRRGNVARILATWTEPDSAVSIHKTVRLLREEGFEQGMVWGDADGLGKPIIDRFRDEMGFTVLPFNGGVAPPDDGKKDYANMISYVWETGCRKIATGKVNVGELDDKTCEQLTERPWKDEGGWNKNGKLQVMPKDEMKRELGIPSPDRADALLGAIVCGGGMSGAVSAADISSARIPPNPFAVPHVEF